MEPAPEAAPATAPQALEVHVIDVGQGDAILIVCPDGKHQLLIDAADTRYPGASKSFVGYLQAHQRHDDPIEVVVASHPHADHIGNMSWVVAHYGIGRYVDNGVAYDSATYRKLKQDLEAKSVPQTHALAEGQSFSIDFCPREDVSAEVLVPQGFVTGTAHSADPDNNASVIVRIDYASDSFLFVGDSHVEMEGLLLHDPATAARLDCDVLKVGHHGSDTSSSTEFLDAVSPECAAISCGARDVGTNKGYKHPREVTVLRLLPRLRRRPAPNPTIQVCTHSTPTEEWTDVLLDGALYVTTADGTVIFRSTGSGITVTTSR